MGRGLCILKVGMSILVNGLKIRGKVLGQCGMQVKSKENMQDHGLMTKETELELIKPKTVIFTKVIGKMIRELAKVDQWITWAQNTQVSI